MIHRKDPVHPHHRQHDAAVLTGGSSGQTGAGSAADHGNILFIGVCHDGRHLFFIDHFHIKLRRIDAVLRHLVPVIFFLDLFAHPYAVVGSHRTNIGEIRFIHLFIRIGHLFLPPFV